MTYLKTDSVVILSRVHNFFAVITATSMKYQKLQYTVYKKARKQKNNNV